MLLKSSKKNIGISSEEIADATSLSRGTVVYHLNKLIEAGLAKESKKKYYLEADSLEGLTEKIRLDMGLALDNLKKLGKEIDVKMKF